MARQLQELGKELLEMRLGAQGDVVRLCAATIYRFLAFRERRGWESVQTGDYFAATHIEQSEGLSPMNGAHQQLFVSLDDQAQRK